MASQLTPLSADQIKPMPAEVRAEAFPVLTSDQISRIRPLSKVRNVKAGDILFEPGDTDIPFLCCCRGAWKSSNPTAMPSGSSSITIPEGLPGK